MGELPRGTVTFLFTDIEGSTRLLVELGAEEYGAALAEHRRVSRDAFERYGGVEVDTQGDAFFVAFPTAPGALEAAREAQDERPDLAAKFKIDKVPTLCVVDDQKLRRRIVAPRTSREITQQLAPWLR